MATKTISGREAAIEVLREMGGRGPIKDVTREAAKRAELGGPTPHATVGSMIYNRAKNGVTFRIPEKGIVELMDAVPAPDPEPVEELSPAVTPGSVVVKDGNAKAEAKPDPKPKPKSEAKKSRKPRAATTA